MALYRNHFAAAAAMLLAFALAPSSASAQVIDTFVADIDPTAVATASDGTLYVATPGRILRIEADGTPVPFAGDGTSGFTGDGGPALAARIGEVPAMALSTEGDLYFIDSAANRIRRIRGGVVTTVAGNGSAEHSGDGGAATDAGIEAPTSLALDDQSVFVTTGHRIRRIGIESGTIQTFMNGSGEAGNNDVYNSAYNTRLHSPTGLTSAGGKLFFADTGNNRIMSIAPSGYYLSHVWGEGWGIPGDFTGTAMALDAGVGQYLAQPHLHRVLRYPHHQANNPYAGDGTAGFAGDGGHVNASRLDTPVSVATAGNTLYIADAGNRRIRRVREETTELPVPPAPTAVPWLHSANVTIVPWTHPAGYAKVEYQVFVEPQTNTSLRFPSTETLTRNFPNLLAGESYTFKVRAIYDDDLFGPWSPASAPVVPIGAQILQIQDANMVEGDSGTRDMVFTVSVTNAPALQDIVFDFHTAFAGLATAEDFDAVAIEGARIPAGQGSIDIGVPVHGDLLVEENEQFLVHLTRDGFAAGNAYGTIVDDDAPSTALAATDDRVFVVEGDPTVTLDVLVNDIYPEGSLAGATLQLLAPPQHGSVQHLAGSSTTAADDRFAYTPPRGFAGEDVFTYRLCLPGRCVDATVTARINIVYPHAHDGGHSGSWGGSAYARRPLSRLRFDATPLRSLAEVTLTLAGDPTPETPWDAGGTGVRHFTLPTGAADTRWRAYVAPALSIEQPVTIYAGIDDDGDGIADREETRCVVDTSIYRYPCELDIDVTAGFSRGWWLVAHNRGVATEAVALVAGAAPLVAGDGTLVAVGPATVADGDIFRVASAHQDPTMVPGDRRIGFMRVFAGETLLDVVPVTAEYSTLHPRPLALRAGTEQVLRLAAGQSQEAVFVDVPAGASALTVAVHSDQPVELHLARATTATSPQPGTAPPRDQAAASLTSATGEGSVTVSGATLEPGRWFVTPVNSGGATAAMILDTQIAGIAPTVRPGSYFNPERSGHGIFLYPAGDQIAGLWYTYRDGGKPIWYYLQDVKPGANGLWSSSVYESTWFGDRNHLVPIGRATVTPTAQDAFVFTYQLLGSVGTEAMTALGRGCPTLGGSPVDASSHWFDPATAGSGYSVQFWENYEYYAAFVYDAQGVARYLAAENTAFGGADATIPLEQLTGFCPTCPRSGSPTRATIGTLRRVISDGTLSRIVVSGSYTGGVPGTWTGDDEVIALGGPGTTQGCTP